MDRFVERCAGLDVHKASVKACIRIPDGHGGRRSETRTFRTTTCGDRSLDPGLRSANAVGPESEKGPLTWEHGACERCCIP
jgi:hypothetical protein